MEGGEQTGACSWFMVHTLEIGKKDAVRGNFNLFHLCFTNEISGNRYTIHATWKGVGGQVRVDGGRGWGPCPPPP